MQKRQKDIRTANLATNVSQAINIFVFLIRKYKHTQPSNYNDSQVIGVDHACLLKAIHYKQLCNVRKKNKRLKEFELFTSQQLELQTYQLHYEPCSIAASPFHPMI